MHTRLHAHKFGFIASFTHLCKNSVRQVRDPEHVGVPKVYNAVIRNHQHAGSVDPGNCTLRPVEHVGGVLCVCGSAVVTKAGYFERKIPRE